MIDDTGNFGIYFLDIPYFHSRQKNFINRFSRSREIEKYVDTRGRRLRFKKSFQKETKRKRKERKKKQKKKRNSRLHNARLYRVFVDIGRPFICVQLLYLQIGEYTYNYVFSVDVTKCFS